MTQQLRVEATDHPIQDKVFPQLHRRGRRRKPFA